MKKIFLTSILLCTFILGSEAQKFVNEFLNIGVGARAHGMFGSVVANVSDGTSAYWNTAGLTEIESPLQLNVMHAKWFGDVANYDYISIAKKLNSKNKTVVAFSFIRLGVDNIPNTLNLIGPDGTVDYNRVTNFSASDYAGIFSYARTLGASEKLSVGGNIKIIHRSIGSFGKSWGFGTDLSLKYKGDHINWGISARDITTTFNAWTFSLTEEEKRVFQTTGNDIPVSSSEVTLPRVIIGGAYHGTRGKVSYLAELDLTISSNRTKAGVLSGKNFNVDPSFGFELGYLNKVFLRGGLGNIQSVINPAKTSERVFEIQPNVGLGLKLGRLKIDYALANIGSVSGVLVSHIFSLSLDFVPNELRSKTP
ncbi:MAG: PorV/PorQ family protein [Saprospiraceae bacterium]|nr:PorV/PorQ family protein [Saprospiraceae bacterium]